MGQQIYLDSYSKAKQISDLANKESYEIYISNSSVVLDAKSLLGLFSLVGQHVFITSESGVDPCKFKAFLDKVMVYV